VRLVCTYAQWRDWLERAIAAVLINHVITRTWIVVFFMMCLVTLLSAQIATESIFQIDAVVRRTSEIRSRFDYYSTKLFLKFVKSRNAYFFRNLTFAIRDNMFMFQKSGLGICMPNATKLNWTGLPKTCQQIYNLIYSFIIHNCQFVHYCHV